MTSIQEQALARLRCAHCSDLQKQQYSGDLIASLIRMVDKLKRPHLCEALIVQNVEDEWGKLCMKPCAPGESYCADHREE